MKPIVWVAALLILSAEVRAQELPIVYDNWVHLDGVGPGGVGGVGGQSRPRVDAEAVERARNAANATRHRASDAVYDRMLAHERERERGQWLTRDRIAEANTALQTPYGSVMIVQDPSAWEKDESQAREDEVLARTMWLTIRDSRTPLGLMFQDVESSRYTTTILVNATERNSAKPASWELASNGNGTNVKIAFDPRPDSSHYPGQDGLRVGESALAHEVTHGWRILHGILEPRPHALLSRVAGEPVRRATELEATLVENWTLKHLNLCGRSVDCYRTTYSGLIDVPSVHGNPLIVPLKRFTYPAIASPVQH